MNEDLESIRLISIKTVAELTSQSPRSIWKRVAMGTHPQPIRLGRSVRWRMSDIRRFIDLDCDMNKFNDALPKEGAP